MHPPLFLSVFWLLPLALTQEEVLPLDCVPRKFVPYHSECCYRSCVTLAYNLSAHVETHDLSLNRLIGKQFNYWWFLNDR